MARKRSLEQTHRGVHTGAVPSTSTPATCPVCGEVPVVAKGQKAHQVLEAHLMAQHRPDVACRREHRGDAAPAWKLDWDAVTQQQLRIWFCGECGFFLKAD
jgi:hypothetical protein